MAVGQRLIGCEVELDAVHPFGPQLPEPRQGRRCIGQLRRDEAPHDLDRQRGNIEIRCHLRKPSASFDRHAAQPVTREIERPERRVRLQDHSEALGQVPSPGIDPDVVGRPGQQAVENAAGHEDAVEELQQDASDGAGAALLRAHRDERAGHPLSEVTPVVLRPRRRPDEIPERQGLELGVVALLAARREREHPRHEERDLLARDVEIVEQREKRGPEIVKSFRESGDPDGVDLARPGEQDPGGLHEVVGATRPAVAERDPAHRVGDVLVEAREEAEAVLSREVLPSPGARAGNRHAPRLAAERGLPLVDGDGEPALGQFVGGAEAADAATQYRDSVLRWHGLRLKANKPPLARGLGHEQWLPKFAGTCSGERCRHGPLRHHRDQMRAVLRRRVDVGVEPARLHRDVRDRLGRELAASAFSISGTRNTPGPAPVTATRTPPAVSATNTPTIA